MFQRNILPQVSGYDKGALRMERALCLLLQCLTLKIKACSETFVHLQQTTQHHFPDDSALHGYGCEKLICHN